MTVFKIHPKNPVCCYDWLIIKPALKALMFPELQLSLFVCASLFRDLSLHRIRFIWDPQHLAHTRHTDLSQKQEGAPKNSLSESLICPIGKTNKQGESLWLEPRQKYFFKSQKFSESSEVWEQAFLITAVRNRNCNPLGGGQGYWQLVWKTWVYIFELEWIPRNGIC